MKILIVGFGSAGQRHAMTALQLGYEVVTWDPATATDDFTTRVATEAQLTHAIICSPPEAHFAQALLCLQQQLHVLVEKPLAMNVVDAQALVDTAKEQGVKLAVACQLRYLSTVKTTYQGLREHLHERWIGRCLFGYDIRRWHPPTQPYTPRVGVLREVGTHELDLLCWLFGTRPSHIQHVVSEYHPSWGEAVCLVDATLQFYHATIHLHLDYLSPLYQRSLLLSSETKYVVWALDQKRDEDDLRAASTAMLQAFLRGEPDGTLATGEDGVEVLRIIETIEEMAVSGQRVTVLT